MKKLTEKQQTIIADITSQFIKINEENNNRPKGKLFDIDGLLGQRDADIEEKYQIELNNKFYDEILQTNIEEDIETLNLDLKELGLRAFRPINWSEWVRGYVIDTIATFDYGYQGEDSISVKYTLLSNPKFFKSGISYIMECKNQHNIEFCNYSVTNIEDFAKHHKTIDKIKTLINKTN